MKCHTGVWVFGCSGVKGKGLFFCSPDVSHKPEVLHVKFAPLLQGLHLPPYSTVPSFPLCSFSQASCEEATRVLCRRVLQNPPAAVLSWWCSPSLWICPIWCPGWEGIFRAVSHQELLPLPMGQPHLLPLCPWETEFWSHLRAEPNSFALSADLWGVLQGCLCPCTDLLPASPHIDLAIYKQAGSELYF